MTKVSKQLLRVISISTGVLAIILGLLMFRHYQPQNAAPTTTMEAPSDPFLNKADLTAEPELVFTSIRPVQSLKIASKIRLTPRPDPIPSPTPTIPWTQFNSISILDSPIVMTFQPVCEDKAFASPEFRVLPWTPDVFQNGEFDISKQTAVAWEHLGYTGLWIHSGFDRSGNPLAAQPLQDYLERKDSWRKRTPDEFDQNAADCLIGSKVSVQVGEDLLEGKVTAVLRIPASDVETVSTHVMDLVPYLAKTYPESGFDKLKAPELLLYFCGRLLTTETPDYSIPDYSRTRIIVAIDFGS